MRTILRTIALLWAAQLPAHAAAEDGRHSIFTSQLEVQLGAQYTVANADVAVTRAPLPETVLDLEDLGIDNNATVFWMNARWHFADRWAASFTYNRFDESGSTSVSETFNFDGVEYPVGAALESSLQLDAYIVDVAYSFGKGQNYEWGAGLGLHAFDFAASLQGTLNIGDASAEIGSAAQSLLAPVPNLRVFADYALNKRNALRFNAGWLSADVGDYDGALLYASARYEYSFSSRFGAGIGIQYTDVDLEHEPSSLKREQYAAEFLGAVAYITYRL